MADFKIHTPETAPEGAKERLKQVETHFGFIPNMLGIQAEAPALLEGYLKLSEVFERTSFTPLERKIVLLSVNYENDCDFCMAGDSYVAAGEGMEEEIIQALRVGAPLGDDKLEALRLFTRIVVRSRGWVDDSEIEAFLEMGYTKQHVLEILLGAALKMMSNYTNHMAETPLNDAFQPHAWIKPTPARVG
jgi:alkylhydroperoxidase family enzyme